MRVSGQIISLLAAWAIAQTACADEASKVEIYQATTQQSSQVISLTGTVEAKQHAKLASLQSGVIAGLYVEVGDEVKKGQKILSLDAKLAELNLEQARALELAALAQVHEAKRLYDEVIELSKQQLVAETLLGERRSNLEIANAQLGRAKAEVTHQQEVLARHTLYAPFAGIIALRHVAIGEWVTQQTPVVTLVEQSAMRLNMAIPQEYFGQLKGKGEVEVTVMPDFASAEPISATLTRIVGVAANRSRTITGLVDLPEQSSLVVGMSARADIQLPASSETLVWLPKSAIKRHPDGGISVFVVENNKAKRLLVGLEKTVAEQVAISGANAELPFVTTGIELLKDGDAVQVSQNKGNGK